jgi:hypothetical protein
MTHECDPRYECVHFKEADTLLRALAPLPSFETQTANPCFVFRGHKCASWKLQPSAFRPDRAQPTKSEAITHVSTYELDGTADDQVWAEFQLLAMFIESCDRAVIPLPEDSYEFREHWMDDQSGPVSRAYRDPEMWPPARHLPLLAYAQHHGVPTRLLDWTRNSIAAAYFAAEGHAYEDPKEDLAIWALNIELIKSYPGVDLVPMPGANSERLGAQRGLFTMLKPELKRGAPLDLQHLTLVDLLHSANINPAKPKPLWKLTLPHGEALRLLYLCHLNGIDAAAVYPDAAGAAKATLQRAAWLRADPNTGLSAVTTRQLDTPMLRSERTT